MRKQPNILGSEKYGTSKMKDKECLLFVEAALKNTDDIQEAIDDMRMIDDILYMKALHKVVHVNHKSGTGFVRKGWGYYDMLNKIIDSRLNKEL
ncbi:hypothetical protein HME7025_00073 [Aquirufa nivalisilvae]|uniref:Uncharacterized protein n=1 Tax=Aquirufa nivalisilvae TaxID=2516557 RepID=A0A2S2DRH9_9BACT|nr:hypothetical protein [Aquirufa nivalisilvae]AWL07958.1 hypothetical protein HME7025_00073 [Aquirufa nivalisilvae]